MTAERAATPSRLDDDAVGRHAKALLADLDAATSYEGRLLTLVRSLRYMESLGHDAGDTRWRLGDVPGFETLGEEVRSGRDREALLEEPSEVAPESVKPTAEDVFAPARVRGWAELARQDVGRLLDQTPGPVTAHARCLATLAAQAHLCCQWGQFAEARPMFICLAGLLYELLGEDESERVGPLVCGALYCRLGALAVVRGGYALLATSVARRCAADLGAIARAAARMEGHAALDPEFDVSLNDSVRGVGPEEARAAAESIRARLLERSKMRPVRTLGTDPRALDASLGSPPAPVLPPHRRNAGRAPRKSPSLT